jgi:hypothetical protein
MQIAMSSIRSKAKAENKAVIPRHRSNRPRLFDRRLLLVGEDAAAYDDLLSDLRKAVKPVDAIEEIFVADMAALKLLVRQWRRWNSALLRECQCAALKEFLYNQLHYDHYEEDFLDALASTLKNTLSEDQADTAKQLAHAYVQNESDAIDKVNKIVADNHLDVDDIQEITRKRKAEELMQKYIRLESNAVALVDKILDGASTNIDDLMATRLSESFDAIEQIDRLATTAENRRNSSLREVYRHRALVGETLRRTVQEVEDAEYKIVEMPPTKGKTAN